MAGLLLPHSSMPSTKPYAHVYYNYDVFQDKKQDRSLDSRFEYLDFGLPQTKQDLNTCSTKDHSYPETEDLPFKSGQFHGTTKQSKALLFKLTGNKKV